MLLAVASMLYSCTGNQSQESSNELNANPVGEQTGVTSQQIAAVIEKAQSLLEACADEELQELEQKVKELRLAGATEKQLSALVSLVNTVKTKHDERLIEAQRAASKVDSAVSGAVRTIQDQIEDAKGVASQAKSAAEQVKSQAEEAASKAKDAAEAARNLIK